MATIRKRANGSWEVRIRRRGYPTLSRNFSRRQDADRFANQCSAEMADGRYIDRTVAEKMTFQMAITRYLQEVTPTKKGHQEAYFLRALLRHPIALKPLADITPIDLNYYKEAEQKRGMSNKSILNALAHISHVFTIAVKEWGIQGIDNPVKRIRKPRSEEARDRRLELGEEDRLMAACEESRSDLLPQIVAFALETGMRRGEIVKCQWEHLKLQDGAGLIRVYDVKDPRQRRSREIPLSTRAREILASLPGARSGQIFKVHKDAVTQSFARACGRAKIKDFRFHDLRHEAISRFFERGMSIVEVAAISGHRTLQMLSRYTHPRAMTI
ncbi:site-specific integrase [Ferrovibrio sp.]|uniref:site-specific integrase n=1 Tax=Ferrovibrio sp. TaxID=1917215 RepID=UPI003D13E180